MHVDSKTVSCSEHSPLTSTCSGGDHICMQGDSEMSDSDRSDGFTQALQKLQNAPQAASNKTACPVASADEGQGGPQNVLVPGGTNPLASKPQLEVGNKPHQRHMIGTDDINNADAVAPVHTHAASASDDRPQQGNHRADNAAQQTVRDANRTGLAHCIEDAKTADGKVAMTEPKQQNKHKSAAVKHAAGEKRGRGKKQQVSTKNNAAKEKRKHKSIKGIGDECEEELPAEETKKRRRCKQPVADAVLSDDGQAKRLKTLKRGSTVRSYQYALPAYSLALFRMCLCTATVHAHSS